MPSKSKKIPSKELVERDKDYQNLLAELKSIVAKGQYGAYKSVDNIRVQTYWQLGERIVREELQRQDRADYGTIPEFLNHNHLLTQVGQLGHDLRSEIFACEIQLL